MIQIIAAAKSATPTNSRTRRETVDPFTSNLHDDRQDERPPARTFAKEPAQLGPELLFDDALVGAFLEARLIHHFSKNPGAIGQQRLAVFHHEPARDDVWHAFERAGLFVDGDYGHDESILGKVTAISQHLVTDFTGPCAVD